MWSGNRSESAVESERRKGATEDDYQRAGQRGLSEASGMPRHAYLVGIEDEDLEPPTAELLEDVDLSRVGHGRDDDEPPALEVECEVATVRRVGTEDDNGLLADLVRDAVLSWDEAQGAVLGVGEERERDEAREERGEDPGRLGWVGDVGCAAREADGGDGVGQGVGTGVACEVCKPGEARVRGRRGWGRGRGGGGRVDDVWEPVSWVGDALSEGELVDEVTEGRVHVSGKVVEVVE